MSEDFMVDYDKFKRTWTIKTELPVEFKLTYSADIFNPSNQDIASLSNSNRRIIVIDSQVWDLYKNKIDAYFGATKLESKILIIDCKEENKNLESAKFVETTNINPNDEFEKQFKKLNSRVSLMTQKIEEMQQQQNQIPLNAQRNQEIGRAHV